LDRKGLNTLIIVIVIIIIIIIVIIVVCVITYVQSIYNYIPEINHVCSVCVVAAILQLQRMIHVMLLVRLHVLHFHISTSRSVCIVPQVAVYYSSLISCFPGLLVGYFLNDLEVVPIADIIIDTTLTLHIPHALYFCCKIFIF
jgi:hypothetical protein